MMYSNLCLNSRETVPLSFNQHGPIKGHLDEQTNLETIVALSLFVCTVTRIFYILHAFAELYVERV